MSKIIEKTIQIQTQEYLDKNGLLYKYQSGFCTNFSTDSCLVQLTDFILREMDKRFHSGIILVDLQKAFDTLDQTVMTFRCSKDKFRGHFNLMGRVKTVCFQMHNGANRM